VRPLLLLMCTGCALLSPASDNRDRGGGHTDGRVTPDARPGSIPDARPGSMPDAEPAPTHAVTVIVEPNGNHGSELVSAIDAAASSVYCEMYQMDDTAVIGALVGQANAGRDVRVILDGSSSDMSWNQSAFDQLQAAGASVVWSSNSFTLTHEKTTIIDGATAWITTMNANTSSPKYNREYLAIDTDASDVAEATAIFLADHAHQTITPHGGLVVAPNNARPSLVDVIDDATSNVDVESEEFTDTHTDGISHALANAVARGVTVRVVIANQTLSSTTQQAVAIVKNAGGSVVMTGPTSGNGTATNPYIHAKTILIDCSGSGCARGYVGSENLSAGSLGYNRELGVVFDTSAQLGKIATPFETDYGRGTAL